MDWDLSYWPGLTWLYNKKKQRRIIEGLFDNFNYMTEEVLFTA